MTSPKAQGDELTPSSYLVTTTLDKDGNWGSETIDIADVPDEILMQYVAQGDQRAAAEMMARITAFEEESGTTEAEPAPAPEEPKEGSS